MLELEPDYDRRITRLEILRETDNERFTGLLKFVEKMDSKIDTLLDQRASNDGVISLIGSVYRGMAAPMWTAMFIGLGYALVQFVKSHW